MVHVKRARACTHTHTHAHAHAHAHDDCLRLVHGTGRLVLTNCASTRRQISGRTEKPMASLRWPIPRVADAHGSLQHIANNSKKAALNLEARDAAWLSRLGRSRSARALQDHLACMEDRLSSRGREGSIKEAVGNRETFLSALHRNCNSGKPFPCGLPETLPKYIAIVNLSGQRMLLTSESDTLMRKLCAYSWGLHPDCLADQLSQFSHYLNQQAVEHTNLPKPGMMEFVLITYSLPWQAGISSAYWELNTVRVATSTTGQRCVRDRELSFSSMSTCIFEARTSLCNGDRGSGVTMAVGTSSEHTLRFVADEQMNAFVNTHRAVDLDAPAHQSTHDEAEKSVGGSSAAVNAVLQSALAQMKLDRKTDQEEVRSLKTIESSLKLEHEKALAKQNEEAIASIQRAQTEIKERERVVDGKVAANWEELNTLRTSNIALLTEIDEALGAKLDTEKRMEKLKKQELSKDKLHNAAASKQTAEIKKLCDRIEVQERASAQQTAELNKAHSHAIEQLEAKAERKHAMLQETLNWKEKVCNQLVENNDCKLAELVDARERLAEDRVRISEFVEECTKLRKKTQDAECAMPKSVSCGTDSQGTTTHHHNATQTASGCIMTDDLPEQLQAALPEPPPWAVAAAAAAAAAAASTALSKISPTTTTTTTTTPSPVWVENAPAPMAAPAAAPVPAPMDAPINAGAEAVAPQPFGTPQMAMNAAMSSLGHLLGWTQFLEAEATQRHTQAHFQQHLVHPQHLVHSQPQLQPQLQSRPKKR